MKIQKLVLDHFSSHPSSELVFERPMALIVGSLNAGKSSLLSAIEYALTGECGYYRKRTDDRSALIHDLSERQAMAIDLHTSVGRVRRVRTAENIETGEWNDQAKASADALTTAVTDSIGLSKTMLSAILNTSNFFELEPAKQKEIIIGLIGAEVTDQKVRTLYTGEAGALKLIQSHKIDSVQAIDNTHDYLFRRRTDAKRELKELKPPDPPEGTAPPLDKLRATLKQCNDELQSKIAEKGRLEGASSAVELRQQLQAKVAALEANKPKGDIESFKKALAVVIDRKASLEPALAKTAKELQELRGQIARYQANVMLLERFNGRCVAGDHACPAPMGDMQKAQQEQGVTLHKLQGQLPKLDDQYLKLTAEHSDQTLIRKAENDLRDYQQRISTWQTNLTSTREQLAALGNAQSDPAQIGVLTEQIDKLRARIKTGDQRIEEASAWMVRDQAVKAVAERRRALEEEVRHLESLVEFFGPKGVKVQLIDERISIFVKQLNEHLQFFGFEFSLQVEPWLFSAKGRPINRLSRSERFRLGIALQIALAKFTGLNMVVADDCEILTPEVRGSMVRMLSAAGLDQSIIMMTLMDVAQFQKIRPTLGDGLDVFMVTNDNGISTVEKI